MICHLYDHRGEHQIEQFEAEPECGKDFCDVCGDCLACYGGDECVERETGHHWIKYQPKPEPADSKKPVHI